MLAKEFSILLWIGAAIDGVFIFMGSVLVFPATGVLGDLGCLIFTGVALWTAIRTSAILRPTLPLNPFSVFFIATWIFTTVVGLICSVQFALSLVSHPVHSPEEKFNAFSDLWDRASTLGGGVMVGVALLTTIAPMLLAVPSFQIFRFPMLTRNSKAKE